MDKDQTVLETGGAGATATEVETTETTASESQSGTDLADALEKTLEKLGKAEEERDNYKRGMLKAKGKATEEEGDDELSLEERIAARVTATLQDKEAEAIQKERDELTRKLIHRNKEMEEALKNKSQISGGAIGASSEAKLLVGDNLLSADQLSELKKRGWDDEKIARFKQNLLKVR